MSTAHRDNGQLPRREVLSEALRLAGDGYSVFPLARNRKTPGTKHGFLDATRDDSIIEQWFAGKCSANLGIRTGDGLVVIDTDPGSEKWLTHERALSLAGVPSVTTPRGGRHYFMRVPQGKHWRSRNGALGPGVDVKCEGGYVVAPPSHVVDRNKEIDGVYRWVERVGTTDDLPLPPAWLIAQLDEVEQRGLADAERTTTDTEEDGAIPCGRRNDALTRIAGSLRRHGLNEGEITAALFPINASRCKPPLEVSEVSRIAGSVAKYPAGDALHDVISAPVPLGQVVRPFCFFTAEVAGMVVHRMSLRDDKPVAEPDLVLAWADGKRERRPMQRRLDIPGGRAIYFDPVPRRGGPRTAERQWGGCAAWLDGLSPDPAVVYRTVEAFIRERIWWSDEVRDGASAVVALWTIFTYVAPVFNAAPYVHLAGPKGSGKSVALQSLGAIVFLPITSSNASAAALFRELDARGGTFLLDEAESLHDRGERASDLRSILLSGHRKGSPARRCEGDRHEVKAFDVYGPKALASIGALPEALASRCIRIPMLRKPKGTRMPAAQSDAEGLRDDLHALAMSYAFELLALAGASVEGLENRDGDIWSPLFALAKWFETWGIKGLVERVRGFAARSLAAAQNDSDAQDSDILHALLELLASGSDPTASDVLSRLRQGGDGENWANWSPERISGRLRSYEVRPRKSGAKRTYRDVPPVQIRATMEAYGMLASAPPTDAPQLFQPSASTSAAEPISAKTDGVLDSRDSWDSPDRHGGGGVTGRTITTSDQDSRP